MGGDRIVRRSVGGAELGTPVAEVLPFRGVRYRLPAAELGAVIAPPYDVVSPEQQAELYDRHPLNIIRVELAREQEGHGDRYALAAATLRQWLAQGVLARDDASAFYAYRQTFALGERMVTRTGFFAAVELHPFSAGVVLPHEGTLAAAKADRLMLMRACEADVSPVFGMFSDPDGGVREMLARQRGEQWRSPDGQQHELVPIVDRAAIEIVRRALSDRPIFIADGHHRYETALALRDELRSRYPDAQPDAAFNYVLMLLVPVEDEGLVILPTHRVLKDVAPRDWEELHPRLRSCFDLASDRLGNDDPAAEGERIIARLREGDGPGRFAAYRGGQEIEFLSLRPGMAAEDEQHDVSILHNRIITPLVGEGGADLGHIKYVSDQATALRMVQAGDYSLALLLRPTTVQQVQEAALAGQRLPGKSTYFYPKVPTGLVISLIGAEERVG
jgi:uncharacterized protein (DUF1015 family)